MTVPGGLAVEIRVNVGAAQIEKAMQVFGIDPDEGKQRRIWFGEVVDGRCPTSPTATSYGRDDGLREKSHHAVDLGWS